MRWARGIEMGPWYYICTPENAINANIVRLRLAIKGTIFINYGVRFFYFFKVNLIN